MFPLQNQAVNIAPPEIQGQIDIGGGGDAEENADPSGGEDNNELDIDE